MHNLPLPGSRALVFGGNIGIGLAISTALAGAGCQITYAARNPSDVAPGTPIKTDLTDPTQAGVAVGAAADLMGGLDIVVFGSARFTPRTPLVQTPLEQVRVSLDINLVSMYAALSAGIPHLEESRSGRFIAISSITGPRTGLAGMAHYGMAKAGMEGLVRTAALEVAPLGITVNAVAPGLIRTDTLVHNYGPQRMALMDALVPSGAMGEPEDIASAVAWLASPSAKFINGAVITADGAMTLVENTTSPVEEENAG